MMKLLLYIVLLLALINPIFAQSTTEIPLSVGVLSENLTHLGLKVGTSFSLKEWQKSKQKRENTILKNRNFILSPQLGFYYHRQNHLGLITNVDLGIRKQKALKKWFHIYAIGLGSLTQFNSGTTYVQQANGDIETKSVTSRTYFTPSLSYETGQQLSTHFGWYAKATLATKLRYNTFFSILPLLEIGIKTNLKRKQQ